MTAYPCPCNVDDPGIPTSVMREMRAACTAHGCRIGGCGAGAVGEVVAHNGYRLVVCAAHHAQLTSPKYGWKPATQAVLLPLEGSK